MEFERSVEMETAAMKWSGQTLLGGRPFRMKQQFLDDLEQQDIRSSIGSLRKALLGFYPQLETMRLVDYKVRILDGETGTAAQTRVLIDSTSGHRAWSTVGSSTNIIEASWQALADSFQYKLSKQD